MARIAKKMTLDIWDSAVLADVKKALDVLPRGHTQVFLNLHAADKIASLALPNLVELSANTAEDLVAMGIRVEIE